MGRNSLTFIASCSPLGKKDCVPKGTAQENSRSMTAINFCDPYSVASSCAQSRARPSNFIASGIPSDYTLALLTLVSRWASRRKQGKSSLQNVRNSVFHKMGR